MNFTTLVRGAAALTALAVSLSAQKPVFTENFESGKIDAWAVWDPFLAAVQTDLKVRVIADGSYANVANYQFYLASRTLAEKHPAVVKIILDEIASADRQALADQQPFVNMLSQSTGIKDAAISLALKRMGYGVEPLSADIAASQQRLAERGNPTDGVSFEIEFVDTDDS